MPPDRDAHPFEHRHNFLTSLLSLQITEAKGRYKKVCEREKAYMEKKAAK